MLNCIPIFSVHYTVKQEKRAGQGMLMRNAASAPSFESIDSNGDGKIKVNEFNRRR